MFKLAKKSLVLLIVTAVVFLSLNSMAFAENYFKKGEPSGSAMIFDAAVVRPLGLVATAVGCVFYVVSSPFSALGGNIDAAADKLVKEPADFTFKRPLGDFN